MNTEFYAFGEILWDCLPSGRHAGGAPFNVSAHLVQLGASASLISAVGQDSLGDEILKVAEEKGVNTQFVTRARIGLATGTVLVTVDDKRQCDLRAESTLRRFWKIACRVGAFVASHNGATPLLPPEITQEFKRV